MKQNVNSNKLNLWQIIYDFNVLCCMCTCAEIFKSLMTSTVMEMSVFSCPSFIKVKLSVHSLLSCCHWLNKDRKVKVYLWLIVCSECLLHWGHWQSFEVSRHCVMAGSLHPSSWYLLISSSLILMREITIIESVLCNTFKGEPHISSFFLPKVFV